MHFWWLHMKHAALVNYLCHLTTGLFKFWLYTHHKHKQDKETYPYYDGKWKQQMYVDVKRQFIVHYNKTVGHVLVISFQNQARIFTHKHRWDGDTLWMLSWHGFWIYKQNTKLRIEIATIYKKLCNKKIIPPYSHKFANSSQAPDNNISFTFLESSLFFIFVLLLAPK